MKRYNPKDLEPKWQKTWEESGIYKASEDASKPKKYVLEYFPYPSGAAMHVGHVRNYTIGDAIARHARMSGYNVLHPMGWDAFGLPAENYAIKNNISPKQAIQENTSRFKQQLTQMGFSYDWSREINSSDPSYYKWTQWFFNLLFERGAAYRKESIVNWDPVDKTVLANEQVVNGIADRSGAKVEKIPLAQWFFKITDYADRLVDDLEDLDWSDSIKSMQRNWIGKSKGAEVDFAVVDSKEKIRVFTTRPDTLFGATFVVLAPEHTLVKEITTLEQKSAVEAYIEKTNAKTDIQRQETDREKTGVFTGAYVVNPVNDEKIPVWIADYVLTGYGTGAIMAVPAHDERDYEFAKKFDLDIKQVIMPCAPDANNPPQEGFKQVTRDTVVVHLEDKSTGKFAVLDWHGSLKGITTAIMGGIEKGETAEEAALREIAEEASLTNVRFKHKLRWITGAIYCASHKGENRKSVTTALWAEVDSLADQGEISAAEEKIHSLVWVDKGEVLERLVPYNQKQMWELLNNETALTGEGEMMNSGKYDGLSSAEARDKIVADLAKNKHAEEKINYKIRDWLISRQRYWGAPIPIIWVAKDALKDSKGEFAKIALKQDQTKEVDGQELIAMPVISEELPVVLPDVDSYQPDGSGKGPLARAEDWVHVWVNRETGQTKPFTDKPHHAEEWMEGWRETDTMDGFACSSWYFLRFADPHNDHAPFDSAQVKFWLPVDDYIGGAEHAVMHLLYARMWTKVMFDAGLIEFNEPFKTLRNQGMILAPDGRKMSKSWGNVIAPDEIIEQGYGADAIRLMELFIGPWNQSAAWSVEGMGGCFRFLQRVWALVQEYQEATKSDVANPKLVAATHKAIKKVSQDMHELGFNTAIAGLMEFVNELYKQKAEDKYASKEWSFALESLLLLLAPFAPHMTEELWQELGHKDSIHTADWPAWDEKYLFADTVTIVVQVNGKVRSQIQVPAESDEAAVLDVAKADKKVAGYLADKEIRKTIYVPGKLVSFVVG